MNHMLTKSPLNRLCKLAHIKADTWMKGFNWESLISLDMQPPHLPILITKDDDSKLYPFLNQIKNFKDWAPAKDIRIDPKTQLEYDNWFKNF